MLALSKDVYETKNLNCAVVRCLSASKFYSLMYWFDMTLIFLSIFVFFLLSRVNHRVSCSLLSQNGEQSFACSDPTAPGPPAHKLLLPAGRQHFPR